MTVGFRFRNHPFSIAVVIAVVFLLIHLSGTLVFAQSKGWIVFSDIYFPLIGFLCSAVLFYAARESRKISTQVALLWMMIALGRFVYTIGDLTWGIEEVILRQTPFPSVSDAFYLLIYPFWILGILFIPRTILSKTERYTLVLDILIVLLSISMVVWNYVILPLTAIYGSEPLINQILGLAYSVLDLFLVWVLIIPFLHRLKMHRRTPITLLCACAVILVITDYAFTYQNVLKTYVSSGWVDNAYLLIYLLSGLAGVSQIVWIKQGGYLASPAADQGDYLRKQDGLSQYLPYFWLAIVYLLFVLGEGAKYPLTEKEVEISFGAIMALVFIRQVLFTHENTRLAEKLKDANLELEAHVSQLDLANQYLSWEVTERVKMEKALRQSEERYRDLFDHATDLIMLIAPNGSILFTNRAWRDALGYSIEETQTLQLDDILLPEIRERTIESFQRAVAGENVLRIDTVFIARDQHLILVEGNANCSFTDGKPMYIRSIFRDVTERKQAEERLVYEAFHDGLTGLPNRAFLLDRLRVALHASHEDPSFHFAVLFLDLDQFKLINDSLGHTLGDEFLIGISRELSQTIRSNDLVARLGGDEFVVLLNHITGVDDAARIAERIIETIKRPHSLEGRTVFSSPSIGIVVDTPHYQTPEEILRDADIAMYRAKALGKGRTVIFDKSMRDYAIIRVELERDLRRALEQNEFHLVYQPIFSLADQGLSGFEALLRWKHPVRGLVLPGEFISIAEETGLILPIGDWVLSEACSQFVEWRQRFPEIASMKMGVNLSPKQFNQPGLVERVEAILNEANLPPQNLAMEITETILMDDLDRAADTLQRLQDLGVQLLIDDFGTGYSSLGYLQQLPIKMIKIDRGFINRVHHGSHNVEIVRAIIQLAHTLGMKVIAEGLEKETQLSVVQDLGCDFGQGYLLSRPAPAEWIATLLGQGGINGVPQSDLALRVGITPGINRS